jgi:hypothetical protein
MSLDVSRLENVRKRIGKTIARCPACAEANGDAKGDHLVIWPNGSFSCVANPGVPGHEHRKRINALAGDPASRGMRDVGIRAPRPAKTNLPEIAELMDGIGRFGRVLLTYAHASVGVQKNECDRDQNTHTLTQVSPRKSGENPSKPSTAVQLKTQDAGNPSRDADELSQHVASFVRAPSVNPSQPSQAIPQQRRQAPPPECGDPLMATALATFNDPRQADTSTQDTAAQDTDPETGFPIIGGAVCPF